MSFPSLSSSWPPASLSRGRNAGGNGIGKSMNSSFEALETARLVSAEVDAIVFSGVRHRDVPDSIYATIRRQRQSAPARCSFRAGRNFRLGARPPSAAACPGKPGRFGSGLRSPLPPVEDPCPLRPATTSSGHRPCAIALITRKEMRPGLRMSLRPQPIPNVKKP